MGKYNSDQRGEDPGDESFSLRMVESVCECVYVCVCDTYIDIQTHRYSTC